MVADPEHASSEDTSPRRSVDSVVIRFAGDSGDGMQLTGTQFTQSTAVMGNDLATFPDYPAEIRAPAGTTFGVSAFQIHFADHDILTPGDAPDVLVAMNPAALKVSLDKVRKGGLVIVNTGAFTKKNIDKAGFDDNPLEDDTLEGFRKLRIDISKHTLESVEPYGLGTKQGLRVKNMWTLGLLYWLYGRDRQPTIDWLRRKFEDKPQLAEANIAALNAGHIYGETAELPSDVGPWVVERAELEPGLYRNVTGSEATAWGMVAGSQLADVQLVLGSYPITPASPMLHTLAKMKEFGVVTFQAEDEIGAVCAAIGASYGGSLGVSSSSGPGVALKMEAMGLAIATELPLIVVDWQRGGPSTGLPTKTEQSDLLQMLHGRNGDAPAVVLSASTPSDGFWTAIEACRLATRYMTPVILMSDGFLANGAEPWRVPDVEELEPFPVQFRRDPEGFQPFARDPDTLTRPWAVPGTPELQHRIGGLEKDYESGNVSYDPDNHQRMTDVRQERIARIADDIPEQGFTLGGPDDELCVVGWGSTYGTIHQAVATLRDEGHRVAHVHLRYLNPLPRNLGELLGGFGRVLVPEMNTGQLVRVLRAELLVPAEGIHKVAGQPFRIDELAASIRGKLPH